MSNGVGFPEARRIKGHNASKMQQQSCRAKNSLIEDSIMSSTYSGEQTEIKDYTSRYDVSHLQTNPLAALKQTTFRPRMHPFNTSQIRKINEFKIKASPRHRALVGKNGTQSQIRTHREYTSREGSKASD